MPLFFLGGGDGFRKLWKYSWDSLLAWECFSKICDKQFIKIYRLSMILATELVDLLEPLVKHIQPEFQP